MTERLLERAAYHEAGHCAAALVYSVPILSVTITADRPHLLRGHYRAPLALGLEALGTLCLAGPAAETFYVGAISDGSDQVDIEMARQHLASRFDALKVEAELVRCRDAADRLVRDAWAQDRIRAIAAALLRHGTLDGQAIAALESDLCRQSRDYTLEARGRGCDSDLARVSAR